MTKKIRCAVLGLGRLGIGHAANLANNINGAELVCVVDPMSTIAESKANELGVNRWTTNWEEVMNDSNIEAVIIATPTTTHADIIKKAAQFGKHIFVEKPLTLHLSEAQEVLQVVEAHKVHCQVGFMRRFDPTFAEAKRRIQAGDIGRPIYYKAISRDPASPPADFISRSGGILVDMSIHDYDMARFLMGSEVRSVASHGSILVNSFMERLHDVDQALTYMTFESGAAGDVEVSRNAFYGYDIRGEVIGTEGTLFIGSLRQHNVEILTPQGNTYDIIPSFPERFKDAYKMEMDHFIDCLRNNESPSVTALDGMIALKIAVAAQKSLELGAEVMVNEMRV